METIIIAAVSSLNRKNGSALSTIKNHIKNLEQGVYKDFDVLFDITIKNAVEKGTLLQPKGPGYAVFLPIKSSFGIPKEFQKSGLIKARIQYGEIFGPRIDWDEKSFIAYLKYVESCNIADEPGLVICEDDCIVGWGFAGYCPTLNICTRYVSDSFKEKVTGEYAMRFYIL